MAGPQRRGGRGNVGALKARQKFESSEHWKYPETIGSDTSADDITFNSHATSEYAIKRMSKISEATHEPFMMFEFMKVDNDNYGKEEAERIRSGLNATNDAIDNGANYITDTSGAQMGAQAAGGIVNNSYAFASGIADGASRVINNTTAENTNIIKGAASGLYDKLEEWAKSLGTLVKRKYTGSICLYMPTDIQINSQMVYNEDSRKMGALAETLFSENYTDAFNPTTLTSTAALTTIGAVAGKVTGVAANVVGKIPLIGGAGKSLLGGGGGSVMSALAGAGLAQVVGTEIQRGSGKIANPNEILMYQSTAMRTFSFAWTILPDSLNESKQAAGLIKMFRKSAHARKDNLMIITVPDHVIVSFHGAKDMIQLPPCVIESVNVTYNPNSSSFFKENNAPVEIGLSIALKEMAPIYAGDIEDGY